ncbi:hypothetical protein [Lentibacillus juripiscarius]|uniref:FAD/FMN-containing dehydrogenase n=1 Tax=Lentibacillus juripiscarius TaxID=257446 RepID=A0ABW5V4M0_9BACI
MKKKLLIIALTSFLVLGIGNIVMAKSTPDNGGQPGLSFEEMVPFMQNMHPNINEQQMEKMYQDCHGSNDNRTGGSMQFQR